MLYLKENPQGIDLKIAIIQNSIFSKLGWNNINVFGRVYKNTSDNGYKPEVYIENYEYKDVLIDDLKTGTVFFIDDEVHNAIGGNDFETDLKIVFMLNLEKLTGNQSRNDIEIQNQALLEIRKNKFFKILKIEKSIETIFRGFDISKLKLNNMQPYHVFAIVGKLKYSINHCNI